jgi:hypothetical protein
MEKKNPRSGVDDAGRLDAQRRATDTPPASFASVGGSIDVGGTPELAAEPPADLTIAREASEDGFSTSSLQRATADPATPSPAAVSGGSEKDLDDLARRLYERIRLRLKRELLVDRERAGSLTDLR